MPRAVRNIFAPKSGRVLRVLLVDYGRDWNERDIARVAKLSRGLAHYVCKTLVELGYVARNEKHRLVLVDPLRLLKRWAAYQIRLKNMCLISLISVILSYQVRSHA